MNSKSIIDICAFDINIIFIEFVLFINKKSSFLIVAYKVLFNLLEIDCLLIKIIDLFIINLSSVSSTN